MLLDFGSAQLWGPDISEVAWVEEVNICDDIGAMRFILNRRGLRDPSPVSTSAPAHYHHDDEQLQRHMERIRGRWYNMPLEAPPSDRWSKRILLNLRYGAQGRSSQVVG